MQNDLISRSEAYQRMVEETKQSGKCYIELSTIERLLNDVETTYRPKKVLKELEKEKEIHEHHYNISVYKHFPEVKERFKQVCIVFDKAIEIVRNGGKE